MPMRTFDRRDIDNHASGWPYLASSETSKGILEGSNFQAY